MPHIKVDGAELFYQEAGAGDALVLVNGGFLEHTQWLLVVPFLASSFRVITFDMRGHGQSTGNLVGDPFASVDDIAALIETLDIAPAHIAGVSAGGLLALHLAARRPELLRSVSVHEPALMSLLTGATATAAQDVFALTSRKIRDGDPEAGLRAFVELVGGDWSVMPPPFQALMVRNAALYDADWFGDLSHPIWHVDAAAIARFPGPVQLTRGDQSPALLQTACDKVEAAIPGIDVTVIAGAGHLPMVEQPVRYATALTSFIERHAPTRAAV